MSLTLWLMVPTNFDMNLVNRQGKVLFIRKKVLLFIIVFITVGVLIWRMRKIRQPISVKNFRPRDGLLKKLTMNYFISSLSSDKDWFQSNITKFEQWQRKTNLNFTVFRRSTVERDGDFSCSSSERLGSCAFKIESIIQGVSLCNKYSYVCVGFVLTKDMMVYLKYRAEKLQYTSEAASFIRQSYLRNMKK